MSIAIYLAMCIVVALFAIGRRGGFLFYFIMSFAITPILAMLVLIIFTPAFVKTEDRSLKAKRK
jgi:hypothetical protein